MLVAHAAIGISVLCFRVGVPFVMRFFIIFMPFPYLLEVDTISALTDAIAVLSKHNFLSVKTSLASIKARRCDFAKYFAKC